MTNNPRERRLIRPLREIFERSSVALTTDLNTGFPKRAKRRGYLFYVRGGRPSDHWTLLNNGAIPQETYYVIDKHPEEWGYKVENEDVGVEEQLALFRKSGLDRLGLTMHQEKQNTIWAEYVYLLSEMAENFGSGHLEGYDGFLADLVNDLEPEGKKLDTARAYWEKEYGLYDEEDEDAPPSDSDLWVREKRDPAAAAAREHLAGKSVRYGGIFQRYIDLALYFYEGAVRHEEYHDNTMAARVNMAE